jgi:hypothetical protein
MPDPNDLIAELHRLADVLQLVLNDADSYDPCDPLADVRARSALEVVQDRLGDLAISIASDTNR